MTDLVDTATGELIAQLDAAQARQLTEQIRQTLRVGHDLLIQAFQGRAWLALGYESWDAYCAGEFAEARMVRLDREQRREIASEMRAAGMSQRAIASGLGVDHRTIGKDLPASGGESSPPAPERSTGSDGKSYPSTRPTPVPRNALAQDLARAKAEASSSPAAQAARAIQLMVSVRTIVRDAGGIDAIVADMAAEPDSIEAGLWLQELADMRDLAERWESGLLGLRKIRRVK